MKRLFCLLRELWWFVTKKRRQQFTWLLFIASIGSVAELFSVGAVLPFLMVISDPNEILAKPNFKIVFDSFYINTAENLIIITTFTFGILVAFSGFIRLYILKKSSTLAFNIGSDVSSKLYESVMNRKYSYHLSKNSGEIIDVILNKANGITYNIFYPVLSAICSAITLSCIVFTGLFFATYATVIVITCFLVAYYFLVKLNSESLKKESVIAAQNSSLLIKAIQESLGSIRDIIIDRSQTIHLEKFKQLDQKLRCALSHFLFLGNSPKIFVETFGVLLIITAIYFLTAFYGGMIEIIPILALIVLAFQRTLPLMQQIFNSWTTIASFQSSLFDVLQMIRMQSEKVNANELIFNQIIELRNISFIHEGKKDPVLRNASMVIKKGERVAIIGETGSGKSTLLDIVMGLLPVTSGEIVIDGVLLTENNMRSWHDHISHVPQSIYLINDTIAANIALNINSSTINYEAMRRASMLAGISSFIDSLEGGYQTIVGENGSTLSGGQRQRIGIARALYKGASIILLDEATSALDEATEFHVMESIKNLELNITLIIVTHRTNLLDNFDTVYKLSAGKLQRQNI